MIRRGRPYSVRFRQAVLFAGERGVAVHKWLVRTGTKGAVGRAELEIDIVLAAALLGCETDFVPTALDVTVIDHGCNGAVVISAGIHCEALGPLDHEAGG